MSCTGGPSRWDEIAGVSATLFLSRGYAAVSLRDIANHLGLRPATLYHHCPGGKNELYGRSVGAALGAYEAGLRSVGEAAGARTSASESRLGPQVHAMALWLSEKLPLDRHRIVTLDLPALADHGLAVELEMRLDRALLAPFVDVISEAQGRGECPPLLDLSIAARAVLALTLGFGATLTRPTALGPARSPEATQQTHQDLRKALDLLLPSLQGAHSLSGEGNAAPTPASLPKR